MASNQKAFILAVALGLCLIPSLARAGADPAVIRAPAPVHRFLDGQNVALHALNAIIMAADIATTRRALQVPGTREANPLMQSQGAMISLKVASVGAGLGIAYMLHKSGHHKAEKVIPMFFGIPSAVSAAHNAGIHQEVYLRGQAISPPRGSPVSQSGCLSSSWVDALFCAKREAVASFRRSWQKPEERASKTRGSPRCKDEAVRKSS